MGDEFEAVYERLAAWCRARDYAGHDPFDALNSRLFQAAPLLRHSRAARLAWTQLFKRSPVNLRRLALVPSGRNPKGLALFALASLSRYRARGRAEDAAEARTLIDELLGARVETRGGGAAWGYDFDWQGRAFYAPRGTPAVVPTAFAVRALVEAAAARGDWTAEARGRSGAAGGATLSETRVVSASARFVAAARQACEFVLRDLNRSFETDEEVCFSYTPLDRTRVFNASLLAAESLASVGAFTRERELLDASARAARYVVRRQRADGSWAYGEEGFQSWADNFHTAFILTSLARVRHRLAAPVDDGRAFKVDDSAALKVGEGFARVIDGGFAPLIAEIDGAVRRGYEFWSERFFLPDGWPKYYPERKYPADAHSAAACVVACAELQRGCEVGPRPLELAERVARWTTRELLDARGFFHYQKRRFHTVRTPFMRWSQSWMLYALARLVEARAAGAG